MKSRILITPLVAVALSCAFLIVSAQQSDDEVRGAFISTRPKTTNANAPAPAPAPARGANSFTEGEARRRIESNGYRNVSALTKDDDGVWRGTAQKGSQEARVWLDFKGNVGQQ